MVSRPLGKLLELDQPFGPVPGDALHVNPVQYRRHLAHRPSRNLEHPAGIEPVVFCLEGSSSAIELRMRLLRTTAGASPPTAALAGADRSP